MANHIAGTKEELHNLLDHGYKLRTRHFMPGEYIQKIEGKIFTEDHCDATFIIETSFKRGDLWEITKV